MRFSFKKMLLINRKEHINLAANSVLRIGGHVCDVVEVLVNGVLVSKPLTQQSDLNNFGFWRLKDSSLLLNSESLMDATIELLVENWGRVNFGKLNQFYQYKGLWQVGTSFIVFFFKNYYERSFIRSSKYFYCGHCTQFF